MSQRSKSVDETMLVNLQVKVNLESFSNHDGFKEGQLERAIEEFSVCVRQRIQGRVERSRESDKLGRTDLGRSATRV
jgi:hypothetical protein